MRKPARQVTLLFTLALVCLGGSCAVGGPKTPEPDWIADAADVLTPEQEGALFTLVADFEERSKVQMVGVTVDNLGGQSIAAYTRQLATQWEVGELGVNNGAMLLLARQERQVHLHVGLGMTWQIDKAQAAAIVEKMVPFLGEDDYFQGFRTGFEAVIAANEEVAWDIAYYTLDEVRRDGEQALGRIATFEAVITGLDDYTARVSAEGVERVQVLLTEEIDPAVFYVESRLLFHARVKEAEPLVLYLLGWEVVEEE